MTRRRRRRSVPGLPRCTLGQTHIAGIAGAGEGGRGGGFPVGPVGMTCMSEDTYGESPLPPAFWHAPMWLSFGPRAYIV